MSSENLHQTYQVTSSSAVNQQSVAPKADLNNPDYSLEWMMRVAGKSLNWVDEKNLEFPKIMTYYKAAQDALEQGNFPSAKYFLLKTFNSISSVMEGQAQIPASQAVNSSDRAEAITFNDLKLIERQLQNDIPSVEGKLINDRF